MGSGNRHVISAVPTSPFTTGCCNCGQVTPPNTVSRPCRCAMRFRSKAAEHPGLLIVSLLALVAAGATALFVPAAFSAVGPVAHPLAFFYLSVVLGATGALVILGAVAGALRIKDSLALGACVSGLACAALVGAAVLLPARLVFFPCIICVEALFALGLAGLIKLATD